LAAVLLLGGCSSKKIRVGGMMCPEGATPAQVEQDLRECRFYGPAEMEAAQKASLPKEVEPECVKCLEEKGYKITE
jgi:hypothetical protein